MNDTLHVVIGDCCCETTDHFMMGSELKVAVHASNIDSVSKKRPLDMTDLVLMFSPYGQEWEVYMWQSVN